MKVILENELEKWAWELMMTDHCKWDKKNGSNLMEQMDWYFFDLHKDETEQMINKDVNAQLADDYGPEGFNFAEVTEEEYVQDGLEYHKDDGMTKQEQEKLKAELASEYWETLAEYKDKKRSIRDEIRLQLYGIYRTFICVPKKLTVVYYSEVFQGSEMK